ATLLFRSSSRRGGPKGRGGPTGYEYATCITATPHRPGGFAATPPRERRGISLGTHRGNRSFPLLVKKGWPKGRDRSLPLLVEEAWPEALRPFSSRSRREGVARSAATLLFPSSSRRGGPKGRGGVCP